MAKILRQYIHIAGPSTVAGARPIDAAAMNTAACRTSQHLRGTCNTAQPATAKCKCFQGGCILGRVHFTRCRRLAGLVCLEDHSNRTHGTSDARARCLQDICGVVA
eukprot:263738-Pleurochrysis_carterae.AAC.1